MKTVQDYLNAPRIFNDPDISEALEPVREIHAIRLKIHDEISGMTITERIEFLNKEANVFLAPMASRFVVTSPELGSWNCN